MVQSETWASLKPFKRVERAVPWEAMSKFNDHEEARAKRRARKDQAMRQKAATGQPEKMA